MTSPDLLTSDVWQVAERLAAEVRHRQHTHTDALRVTKRAQAASAATYESVTAAVLAWRTLTVAIVDGAGNDRTPALADALNSEAS